MADVREQKSALWRRKEQLDRWNNSETNKEPAEPRVRSTVKFPDGCQFLAACSAGDKLEVERLLARGADINTANIDGLTALHQACIDDNLDMVKFLVKNGADVDACDNEGWTSLHATASCGFLEIAKYLIEAGADVSRVNNDGELAIDIAEGEDMEQLLLEDMERKGVDAEASRAEEEEQMLEHANKWLDNELIDEIPHPKTGATALHVAAAKGYIKVMTILIQAGVDINVRDNDGWTALHAAAHWGQEESCKILVENFCDMDATNNVGQTAFDVAETDLILHLEELKKRQLSLKKDREANMKDIIQTRVPPPLKRRSSVTRMSVDQKQNIITKHAEEERAQMEKMMIKKIEDEKKSSSSSSGEESSSDSETEKKNAINRQSTLTSRSQANGAPSESPKVQETPKIEDSTSTIKPPPPRAPQTPRIQDIAKSEELKRDLAKDREKEKENLAVTVSKDREEKVEEKTKTEESEKDKKVAISNARVVLGRTITVPPKLTATTANGNRQPSITSKPEVREPSDKDKEKDMDGPAAWRAGLRKMGSTSTVPETNKTEEHEKLARSASSPWLASEKKEESSRPKRLLSANIGDNQESRNRFNDLYTRYTSLLNNNKGNPTPLSSSSTQSAYGSFSRRRQLELEERERARASAPPGTSSLTTSSTIQRRSFEPPKRDEETETQRKARAKRARETRRSTQGVKKEDLERAEQTLQAASRETESNARVHASSEDKSDKENKPEEPSSIRRKGWEKDKDEERNSFTRRSRDSGISEPSGYVPRSSRTTTSATTNSTTTTTDSSSLSRTPSYRSKYLREKEEEEKKEKEAKKVEEENNKDDPSQKSSAIRARRKRSDRRPTGKIELEDLHGAKEEDSEKDSKKSVDKTDGEDRTSSSRYGTSRYSDPTASPTPSYDRYGSSRSERPTSYSGSTYSRSYTSSLDKDKDKDFKKLYDEEKAENERLKKEIKKLQQELSDTKQELEKSKQRNESSKSYESSSDKRERRALERKLSEMEEELKNMEKIKADNAKLKEENRALTRVVSKLSK